MPGRHPINDMLDMVRRGDLTDAEQQNLLIALAGRTVDVPNSITMSEGTIIAPTPRVVAPGLKWCMLMENHPGRGLCFNVVVGTWCQNEAKFRFNCSAASYETAIDWHNGVTYPLIYAQGWFQEMPFRWSTTKRIYVCVSLDCTSDGSCTNHQLTDGACPEQLTTPCT